MKRIAPIVVLVAMALSAGVADAKSCKDPKTGKFTKCAAPAAATRCKDASGKFAKCSAPGARPA